MTPDQAKKAAEFLSRWDEDWGFFAEQVAKERGMTRLEALLFITAMQVGAVRDELAALRKHPEYREDCEHCRTEKANREVSMRYMERAIKHMDEEHGPEDWQP